MVTIMQSCCGCTPALSSVLSVWISGFLLCTHICSFSWFSPAFVVFPLCFPIGSFSCVLCLCMLLGHMGCMPLCRRQFFYTIELKEEHSVKSMVNKMYPVRIIYVFTIYSWDWLVIEHCRKVFTMQFVNYIPCWLL